MHPARRLTLLLALLAIATIVAAGCGGSDDDTRNEDSDAEAAVEAGIAYEEAILPVVTQLAPLLQRYDTTSDRLIAGTMDVPRAVEAFGRQSDTAVALAKRVRAVDVDADDDHLEAANEQLAVSLDRYAAAMDVMTSFDDGMSEAQVEQTFARATSELDEMFAALDTWSTALVEDPEGRAFTRTGAAFTEISASIDSL